MWYAKKKRVADGVGLKADVKQNSDKKTREMYRTKRKKQHYTLTVLEVGHIWCHKDKNTRLSILSSLYLFFELRKNFLFLLLHMYNTMHFCFKWHIRIYTWQMMSPTNENKMRTSNSSMSSSSLVTDDYCRSNSNDEVIIIFFCSSVFKEVRCDDK